MTTQPGKMDQLILIAEDSDDDFEITVHALKKSGNLNNPIVRVEDGSALLDYLFKKGDYENYPNWKLPCIVLLDLNMPGIDGRTALKEIKESDKHKNIPIVVLTTSNDPQDIEACYQAGANSYIQKPVDLEGFIMAVKQLKEYWFEISILPKSDI